MARFLSAPWLDELAAAVRDDEELEAATVGVSLTVQQVVTGGPDGDVAWYVRLADGKAEIGTGRAADADVVITETYETATAVSRDGLSPAEAFARGRLKLAGRVGLLARHRAAFERLAGTLSTVRDLTTYT
jgi:hypothetical protein